MPDLNGLAPPDGDVGGDRSPTSPLVGAALGSVLAVTFMVRAWLLPRLNVNWDEFYFLSKIHDHLRGNLDSALMTFHVHLLSWVTAVSTDEVDQVMALRAVMFGLGIAIASALVFIGRQLHGSLAAGLFSAVLWSSFSLVAHFGSSARFDPLVACFVVVAVALLLGRGRTVIGVAGIFVALAAVVSPKAVFLMPAVAGALWWRWRRDRRGAEIFGFIVVVIGLTSALWAIHLAGLAPPAPSSVALPGVTRPSGPAAIVAGAFREALPHKATLKRTLAFDVGFWMLALIGLAVAVGRSTRGHVSGGAARDGVVVVVGCALPLLSIAVYRNSFGYFYATLVPVVAIVPGALAAAVERRLPWRSLTTGLVLVGLLSPSFVSLGRFVRWNGDDQVTAQRIVVDVVHEVFPHPVAYIDRCGMVSSHQKVGPFMSTWVMQTYRERGEPIMRDLLRESRPLYVLDNVEGLELDDPQRGRPLAPNRSTADRLLLPEDFAVLAGNFVHHWGPLWVAGQHVDFARGAGDRGADIEVLIAGEYRVEADKPVVIDGMAEEPGAVVALAAGAHRVTRSLGSDIDSVTLRIAEARPPPATRPPPGPLFARLTSRHGPAFRWATE